MNLVGGGIIIVDRLSALRGRDTLQTETRVFRINYSSAEEVASALQELSGENAQVVPYEETNSVIATAPRPTIISLPASLAKGPTRHPRRLSM